MALTLVYNNNTGVGLGGVINITTSNIKYKSSDSCRQDSEIVYTVTKLPEKGIMKNKTMIMKVGDTFTQSDLSGSITYTSDASVLKRFFDLELSVKEIVIPALHPTSPCPVTGASTATLKHILEVSIPAVPPEGTVNPLTVIEDKDAKITTGNISFDDANQPGVWNNILFEIQVLPLYGYITKNGTKLKVGGLFTQDDINKGRIKYVHDSALSDTATEDHLFFQAMDAGALRNPVINDLLIIIKLEDLPLVLVNNGPVTVDQGATLPITNANLKAEDIDDPGLVVTYTLLSVPKYGELLIGGIKMLPGDSFTQAQIDAGGISYKHLGGIETTDKFDFIVANDKTTLMPNPPFNINIKPVPNLPPIVETLPVTVDMGQTAIIDKSYITITDPEGMTPDKMPVKITELPKYGTLFINGSPATVGQEITVQQVLDGAFSYKHNGIDVAQLNDSFKFEVSDNVNKVIGTVNITVIYKINTPPYMVKNVVHTVLRTSTTKFNYDEFDFDDDDTVPENVELIITSLPLHGILTVNGSPVTVGQVFKKSNWNNNLFQYDIAITDFDIMEDFFGFTLTDGENEIIDLKHYFKFPPPPVGCPELTVKGVQYYYYSETVITELDMIATDAEVESKFITYTLTEAPAHGWLELNDVRLAVGDTWTNDDIIFNRLTYRHVADINAPPTTVIDPSITLPETDQFLFSVTNGGCTVNGTYKIRFFGIIKEIINQPVYVTQGEFAVINGDIDPVGSTGEHLVYTSESQPDPASIVFIITNSPKFGTIQVNGADVSTFTQADLNNGLVKYVHNDDPDATADSFDFSATDGISTELGTLEIIIELVNKPPVAIINGLTVGELLCKTFSSINLNFTDDRTDPQNILITIQTLPINGTLLLNGVPVEISSSFSFKQVIDGKLSYCNTVINETSDSFDFEFSDGEMTAGPETFPIDIIPAPPVELNNNLLTMEVCSTRTITTGLLSLVNIHSVVNLDDIVFTIESLPDVGDLFVGNTPVEVGQQITQTTIRAGTFTYKHDSMSTDPTGFAFSVTSPEPSPYNGSGIFTISFVESFNLPWVCVNQTLTVKECTTEVITLDYLQMCDLDLDAQDDIYIPPNITDVGGGVENDAIGLRKIGSVEPGKTYTYNFSVSSGFAELKISDPLLKVLSSTGCVNGGKTGTFTVPAYVYEIMVDIRVGCAPSPNGSVSASWSLSFQ